MIKPPRHSALWAFAVFCLASLPPLFSAERVALVIGNNAYKHGTPLRNCINDARAVAGALKRAGFEVIVAEDASLETMEAKALEFRRSAQGAKAAWFHYSGHGVEMKGSNYLVPVDADVKEEFQVKHKAYALDQMLGAMEEAGTPLKVVVLDCCRDNPFGKGWSRSGAKGLGQIGETPKGTIIAFATSPGKVADDGVGSNSPFTTALVAALGKPGLDVKDVFNETGRAVLASTGNSQQPWINSSFFDNFILRTDYANGGALAKPGPETVAPAPSQPTQEDAVYRKRMRELAELGDFVEQYNLGLCYYNGTRGILEDRAEAVRWYQKAAEQGFASAQHNLGCAHGSGIGVPKNETKAVEWFLKAAEQGYAESQFALGVCYDGGIGVKENDVTACMWYIHAAALPSAKKNLEIVSGEMTAKQVSQARQMSKNWKPAPAAKVPSLSSHERLRLYTKLSGQGNTEAQMKLGDCYETGDGCMVQDHVIAYLCYTVADSLGHVDAKNRLKWLCRKMTSEDVARGQKIWRQQGGTPPLVPP